MSNEKPPVHFRAGDFILQSGLYRVFHADHRVSHKALLLRGNNFPRCAICADDVHFEIIMAAPEIDTHPEFASFRTLNLYEIPHPDRAEEEKETA